MEHILIYKLSAIANTYNLWLAIYMKDTRYSGNRWQIIKGNEDIGENPLNILYYSFYQGIDARKGLSGHYNALIALTFKDNHDSARYKSAVLGRKLEHVMNEVKVILLNCRSIRDLLKRDYLMMLLNTYKPMIAILSETFLIAEDKFHVRGYRVYRNKRR